MNHIIVENSEESIANAIETAKQLFYVMQDDLKKQEELSVNLERYEKILNFTHDGILAVDDKGVITVVNSIAEKIINKKAVTLIGKKIDLVLGNNGITEVLISKTKQLDRIIEMNGTLISQNCVPIMVDKEIKGAVATFQDIKTIQKSEINIRNKIYNKGMTAKYNFNNILGESNIINNIKNMALSYSKLNSTILINGETGTGKELFAHSIHNMSDRSNAPFVTVNCATLPKSLIESELFGYRWCIHRCY